MIDPHLKCGLAGVATGAFTIGFCKALESSAPYVIAPLCAAFALAGLYTAILDKSQDLGAASEGGYGPFITYVLGVPAGLMLGGAVVNSPRFNAASEFNVDDVRSAYYETYQPTFAETLDPVQRAYFDQIDPA